MSAQTDGAATRRGPMGGHGPGHGMMPGEKPKDFKGTLKKMIGFMGRFKAALVVVLVFAIGSTVFNIVGPKVLSTATTELFNGIVAKIDGSGGINFDAIAQILLFTLGLYLLSAACSFVQGWIMSYVSQRTCYLLRRDIAEKIDRMPFGYFERTSTGDVLSRIASALVRGQQKRVLQLCSEALESGRGAQEILTDGLVRGMTILGEDFSANRAFVPEMLIAARCMAAATELLKPYMTGESSETIGRVCLGTVRGDMHDIGKNLVKIMMEGSGLEVVDLGVDVTAEQFVDTAIEQHCDIIACSSLLTTTMPEMRDVVELAKARGIRDRVKIFVGGAPITPGYSDEIGADVYCPDAATAARSAVALLRGA